MTEPVVFARGLTTGAQLLAAIDQRARTIGIPVEEFLLQLNTKPSEFIKVMRRSQSPTRLTFARVEALLNGKPIPPAQRKPRVLTQPIERQPSGPIPDPVDRDPCLMCGIRADIGCKHRRPDR